MCIRIRKNSPLWHDKLYIFKYKSGRNKKICDNTKKMLDKYRIRDRYFDIKILDNTLLVFCLIFVSKWAYILAIVLKLKCTI